MGLKVGEGRETEGDKISVLMREISPLPEGDGWALCVCRPQASPDEAPASSTHPLLQLLRSHPAPGVVLDGSSCLVPLTMMSLFTRG